MLERDITEVIICLFILLFTLIYYFILSKNPDKIRLIDFAIIANAFSFAFAPFVVLLSGYSLPRVQINTLYEAYLGIIIFLFGMWVVKKITILHQSNKKKSQPHQAILSTIFNQYKRIDKKIITILLIIAVILKAYYVFKFDLFWYGAVYDANYNRMAYIPYIWTVLNSYVVLIQYVLLIWALLIFIEKNKNLYLLAALIITSHLFFYFQSRGAIIMMGMIYLMLLIVHQKLNLKRFLKFFLLAVTMFLLIFPYLTSARLIFRQNPSSSNIIDIIGDTFEQTITKSDSQVFQYYYSNVSTRSYIIYWNYVLIENQESQGYMNGEVLLISFYQIIPKLFFPGKYSMKTAEDVIKIRNNIPNTDVGENLIYEAQADFGLVGCFLYGLIIGLILLFTEQLSLKIYKKYPILSIGLIITMILTVLTYESTLVYVMGNLRDYLILLVLIIIIRNLLSIKKVFSFR